MKPPWNALNLNKQKKKCVIQHKEILQNRYTVKDMDH